jgi:hypothetical protein
LDLHGIFFRSISMKVVISMASREKK